MRFPTGKGTMPCTGQSDVKVWYILWVSSIESPFWEFVRDVFVRRELLAFILFFLYFHSFSNNLPFKRNHNKNSLPVLETKCHECKTAPFSFLCHSTYPNLQCLALNKDSWDRATILTRLTFCGRMQKDRNDWQSFMYPVNSEQLVSLPQARPSVGTRDHSPHRQCAAYTDSRSCVFSCTSFSPSEQVLHLYNGFSVYTWTSLDLCLNTPLIND